MPRLTKSRIAITLLALFAFGVVLESQADAGRRYRRAFYRAPVVVAAPVAVRAPYVRVAPRSYYRGYRGFYGGGVSVGGPRFGVSIGW